MEASLKRENVLYDPGLVANATTMHCLHACLIMALRTAPGISVPSFEELDKQLRTDPSKYTWQYALMRVLAERNFAMQMIETFDTDAFLFSPVDYCIAYFGEEVGKDQVAKSDFEVIIDDLREIKKRQPRAFLVREPGLEDIARLVSDGWYCLCNVNQRILQADPGYVGHMIFIFGTSSRGVRVHNPGPPAASASEISWELFDKAWSYPTAAVRNILAVKLMEAD